jgi:peptide/nickel transport system substrate-binding protein
MKPAPPICKSLSGTIFLVVLMTIGTLCGGPVNAASEPGTITITLPQEPITMEPIDCSRAIEGQVMMKNIVETLTEINFDNSVVTPRLATSWKQVDASTWHFALRKGVKFHDGEDFTAEAVVFNIKRIYETKTPSNTRMKFFSSVKMEGKALDNYTLEVKTNKPEPLMLTLMANLPVSSPNTPADKATRSPMGTGPYRFVKWDQGVQIIMESFEGYWGKQPQVKKAIYVWRSESAVRAAMVAIGEADLAPNIAQQDANRPDMDRSYLNSETTFLRFGGEWEPPLNDRRVRMALSYALDRNAIRGTILSKDAIPASQLIVPSTFGYNPEIKAWPYDPQKARQLLDEARKDSVPVDREILLVGRIGWYPGSDELMEAVMTMYKAVGLNVKLRILEAGVFNKSYSNKPYTTSVGPYIVNKTHDNNKGDAGFTAYLSYHCRGGASSMCDKMVDDLIEKAQVASGEERRTLWQAAFKRIHEEIIPNVMLFHMVAYARIGKRINFKPSLATNSEIELAHITFK